MPGKSRHGKSKHAQHSKKYKAMRRQAGIPLQPQATIAAPKPAVPVGAMPAPKTAAEPAAVATPQYPYVRGELKRIAIFAGIIIIALIVLSIVIS
jgi:hypothetical protein